MSPPPKATAAVAKDTAPQAAIAKGAPPAGTAAGVAVSKPSSEVAAPPAKTSGPGVAEAAASMDVPALQLKRPCSRKPVSHQPRTMI